MENIVLTKRSILKKQMVAYIIELNLRRGDVDKVVNIGENGTVLS